MVKQLHTRMRLTLIAVTGGCGLAGLSETHAALCRSSSSSATIRSLQPAIRPAQMKATFRTRKIRINMLPQLHYGLYSKCWSNNTCLCLLSPAATIRKLPHLPIKTWRLRQSNEMWNRIGVSAKLNVLICIFALPKQTATNPKYMALN